MTPGFHVVTGAFGYSGAVIARQLLELGLEVRTVTGHPERPSPLRDRVPASPFHFDRPDLLTESLKGAAVLYNTYWVRFPRGRMTFDLAMRNTRTLLRAAGAAGVSRVVHVSIANPSLGSELPYYASKAELERDVVGSSMSHAILRPTVIFGPGDILINNIAWFVRHAPLFAIPGDGRYRMQPVFVEDFAQLAVSAGQTDGNLTMDAVGPEVFAFEDLVLYLAELVGRRLRTPHVPPALAWLATRLYGPRVHDVILTRDEIRGLMANLLVSDGPPTGSTRLTEWLQDHTDDVGLHYASELQRHYR